LTNQLLFTAGGRPPFTELDGKPNTIYNETLLGDFELLNMILIRFKKIDRVDNDGASPTSE
jgi:hypothetical protein